MSTVVLYCWCHSDSASVLLYFTLENIFQPPYNEKFLKLTPQIYQQTCQIPQDLQRGNQIITPDVKCIFVASQAGDADSSRAPGLTSGLQGSVNIHRGALLLVPQWQCISSFVFYIYLHFLSSCQALSRASMLSTLRLIRAFSNTSVLGCSLQCMQRESHNVRMSKQSDTCNRNYFFQTFSKEEETFWWEI